MNLTNATQGIYSVTITDNLGCTSTLSGLNLESQLNLKGILKSKKNPLCHLQSNGSIEFEGSFGHPPYMYSWNTCANGPLLNNVKEGIYQLASLIKAAASSLSQLNWLHRTACMQIL